MDTTQPSSVGTSLTRPHPRPAARPQPSPRKRRRGAIFVWLSAGALVLAAAPVLLGLGTYAYYQMTGTIVPGVRVQGAPLQGLTVSQAAQELDQTWNQETLVSVVDTSEPSRIWLAQPSEFGLGVNALASAQRAFEIGHAHGLLASLSEIIQGLQHGWEVAPVVVFDPAATHSGLEAWSSRVYIAPVDGTLDLEGSSLVQASGQEGKAIDMEATLAMLAADPAGTLLTYRFIPLIMRPVAPRLGDVSAAAAEAERLLSAQPALRAYDPVTGEYFAWSPSREEIASWLRIERGETAYQVGVDESRVSAYVAALNDGLGAERFLDLDQAVDGTLAGIRGEEAATLIVHYRPRSYMVGARDTLVSIGVQFGMPYWKIEEANPQVAARGLSGGETITIPPQDAMLALPVVPDRRIVISISEQRLRTYENGELVSEHVISTGIARSPTLPGLFQVQSHILEAYASRWDLYMPHFLGIYEAVPGFWNGIHGLPLLSNGVRLWANVLGRPASYGCIILDLEAGEWLYNWAEDGVVVEITR